VTGGREIAQRVERHLRIDGRADRNGARARKDRRIAVRRALRHEIGADDAVRACAVLHDHLMAEELGQLRRNEARNEVDRAARRERDHEAHRVRGIVLRTGAEGDESKESGEGRAYGHRSHACSDELVADCALRYAAAQCAVRFHMMSRLDSTPGVP
jgi:hypothetical protein